MMYQARTETNLRWWDIGATCAICGHAWRCVIELPIVMVEGLGYPDVPDKVECPKCEEMYGDLEV